MADNRKRKAERPSSTGGDAASRTAELVRDAGGYDWGWPSVEMVSANVELLRRLGAGGFTGCGYGFVPPDGPPFISLLGTDAAGMRSAATLLKEWVSSSGPNAIFLEIGFVGAGYAISISQHPDLLRWRLAGLDTVRRPIVATISHMKRFSSRHPLLDQLAQYSQRPLAPVWLVTGTAAARDLAGSGSRDISLHRPDWANAVLLPGIDVYTDPKKRPWNSMLRLQEDDVREPADSWPPAGDKDPASLSRKRERRLMATMPKTIHALRHQGQLGTVLRDDTIRQCATWQVEQAICNLRLRDHLPYKPNSASKLLAMMDVARDQMVEPASTVFDPAGIRPGPLAEQIALDSAYLLRRVDPDVPLPVGLSEGRRRLEELGFG